MAFGWIGDNQRESRGVSCDVMRPKSYNYRGEKKISIGSTSRVVEVEQADQ